MPLETEHDHNDVPHQPAVPPRRIVVGVDPSAHAASALRWAAQMAAGCGASLVVVHGQGLLEGSGLRPRFEIERFVEDTLASLEREGSSRPPTIILTHPGPGAQALMTAAREQDVDLIVVGQRGVGGSLRPLGSTSEWVLAQAEVPVVVLPLHPSPRPAGPTDQ
ncbi:MAG: universal stress protein [Acidimicrobiales bacterium]